MSNLIRSRASKVTVVLATAAVSLGMFAGPAAAARDQAGLVVVNVEDNEVLNDAAVQVAVPVQAAANICGVAVGPLGVLAEQAAALDQHVECDADTAPQTVEGPVTGGRQDPGNPNA